MARALALDGWIVTPDRDNFDYVIDSHEWVHLRGGRHHGRRRALRAFTSVHETGTWEVAREDDWALALEAMGHVRSKWASRHPETALELLAARQLLQEHQVRWLNVEQDLGLPGLRERKMHHGPARMLEKCTATLP